MSQVLMIEDNPNDIKLIGLTLASVFDFLYAASVCEALEVLKTHRPDIILLDLGLPDSKGVDTIDLFVKSFPQIPVVVWSGADDAAEAIRHGAENFILKGRSLSVVEEAITNAIKSHKFTQVKQDIATMQKVIETDNKSEKP